jgi:quercetin dioxygenase-like cupin family protein
MKAQATYAAISTGIPTGIPDIDFEPAFSGKVWFLPNSASADVLFYAHPHASDIPEHVHPAMTETFVVLEGQLDVFFDNHWHELTAGQTLEVPPGVIHTIRNATDQPCIYRCLMGPGTRFQDLLVMYGTLIATGKLKSIRDIRSLCYLGMMYESFRDVQVMTGLTGKVLYLLGGIGRRLGFTLPPIPVKAN